MSAFTCVEAARCARRCRSTQQPQRPALPGARVLDEPGAIGRGLRERPQVGRRPAPASVISSPDAWPTTCCSVGTFGSYWAPGQNGSVWVWAAAASGETSRTNARTAQRMADSVTGSAEMGTVPSMFISGDCPNRSARSRGTSPTCHFGGLSQASPDVRGRPTRDRRDRPAGPSPRPARTASAPPGMTRPGQHVAELEHDRNHRRWIGRSVARRAPRPVRGRPGSDGRRRGAILLVEQLGQVELHVGEPGIVARASVQWRSASSRRPWRLASTPAFTRASTSAGLRASVCVEMRAHRVVVALLDQRPQQAPLHGRVVRVDADRGWQRRRVATRAAPAGTATGRAPRATRAQTATGRPPRRATHALEAGHGRAHRSDRGAGR